jgi:aldose sugar dehydrogenase
MIVRGRIRDGVWVDQQTIFQAPVKFYRVGNVHFGGRLVFHDGYLFFSIGERGAADHAQDLTRPNGKIHRIFDDGRIPSDNPFIGQADAFPTIWSYGHRNPQGLVRHPVTGELWDTEHGPRGGDELNLIKRGQNYGWPKATYGMNYSGTPVSAYTSLPGMVDPVIYWTPSIAACGLDVYTGDQFPKWKNQLFAGGLAKEEVQRLVIENGKVTHREIIFKNHGRVRDVCMGPDGLVYILLNSRPNEKESRIVRLRPVR